MNTPAPVRIVHERRSWIRRTTDWVDERTGEIAPMAISSRLDKLAGSSGEPEDPKELLRLGREDLSNGNLLRAQTRIQKAFDGFTSPADKAAAASSLGAIWRERGETTTAVATVRPWAEKGHPGCLVCLAGAYVDQGEKSDAVKLLNEAIEKWPRLGENSHVLDALKAARSQRKTPVARTVD
jgi:Flp pilus assembly protein TadD